MSSADFPPPVGVLRTRPLTEPRGRDGGEPRAHARRRRRLLPTLRDGLAHALAVLEQAGLHAHHLVVRVRALAARLAEAALRGVPRAHVGQEAGGGRGLGGLLGQVVRLAELHVRVVAEDLLGLLARLEELLDEPHDDGVARVPVRALDLVRLQREGALHLAHGGDDALGELDLLADGAVLCEEDVDVHALAGGLDAPAEPAHDLVEGAEQVEARAEVAGGDENLDDLVELARLQRLLRMGGLVVVGRPAAPVLGGERSAARRPGRRRRPSCPCSCG